MNSKLKGHLAAFAAYAIFGFNVVISKDITSAGYLSPFALFSVRAMGATLLFWLLGAFMPKEVPERRDLPKIFVASLLGLFITQVSFLFAIRQSTPLDYSILTGLAPIFTMFVAAIVVNEPITLKKSAGVLISFAGMLFFIFNSAHADNGVKSTSLLGFVLIIVNVLSFALYLGIFRPLISKYSVVTFMKWMFLFAALLSLPFTVGELARVQYSQIAPLYFAELAFLVVMATFVAYFLVPLGQKHLRPTAVSLYSYLQPIIASLISIILGIDTLSLQKIVAAVIIICGAVLVNRSRAAQR